jgi:hypothetical protein
MENDRILIGALLFIVIIVGINLAMYGIVRGMTKGGESNWMSAMRKSLNKPLEGPANKSMDELRKKMEELQGKNEKKQD